MIFIGLTSTIKSTLQQNTLPLEEEWILRVAKGDQQAFASLYQATASAVYGFALSILKDHTLAEDVMQDAYLKIHAGAEKYRPQGKPMAWVLRIVRSLSLMKLRQLKENSAVSIEESWDIHEARDFVSESNNKLLLQAAMQILTDEERQIVTLYAVSGMKHREIASLVGLPLPTVLSKYRRAQMKLKKRMEEQG